MNYRLIIKMVGKIMCLVAVFMIPAFFIAFFNDNPNEIWGFVSSMVLLFAIGFPCSLIRQVKLQFYARDGFVTVAICWIAVSILGAVPFYFSGAVPSFVNCLFESVSGFTTTGATVIADVEALPMGLLYWRSFTHWLGGMGVLVFVLALTPNKRGAGHSLHLLRAESTGPNVGKLVPKLRDTAKILYTIYICLTLLHILFLLLGHNSFFDSINIAFSTAGTGGFSIRNHGFLEYSVYTQNITTVFMLLFSVNFGIFYFILTKEFSKIMKSSELWGLVLLFCIATLCIALNIFPQVSSFSEALQHASFQVASIMSTTGFATTDYNVWPEFSKIVLVMLTMIGASAGSTAGGMKISRLIIVLKSVRASIYGMLRPNSVNLIHMDGELIEADTQRAVHGYIMILLFFTCLSTLLISLDGFSMETNLTAAISTLSNVGPGFGAIGPMSNFNAFSAPTKILFCFNMLLGRLELYPILILFTPTTWRK